MMMQENLVTVLIVNPNLTAKSTTGTTVPRKLVTPRIHAGVLGTIVTASNLTISFTLPILTPYSSPAVKKVRYCTTVPGSRCWFEAFMFTPCIFSRVLRQLCIALAKHLVQGVLQNAVKLCSS